MVRVASDSKQVQSGRWSLVGAVGAGLVALLTLTLLREAPPQSAPQRSLLSYPVRWTCEKDATHEFTANGRFDPMPCRHAGCDGLCSIRMVFICEQHHEKFDAWVRFGRVSAPNADDQLSDREHIVAYRYSPSGTWQEASDGRVPCPKPGCQSSTRPVHSSWSRSTSRTAQGDTAKTESTD